MNGTVAVICVPLTIENEAEAVADDYLLDALNPVPLIVTIDPITPDAGVSS